MKNFVWHHLPNTDFKSFQFSNLLHIRGN